VVLSKKRLDLDRLKMSAKKPPEIAHIARTDHDKQQDAPMETTSTQTTRSQQMEVDHADRSSASVHHDNALDATGHASFDEPSDDDAPDSDDMAHSIGRNALYLRDHLIATALNADPLDAPSHQEALQTLADRADW
jgi:hypothetical protein